MYTHSKGDDSKGSTIHEGKLSARWKTRSDEGGKITESSSKAAESGTKSVESKGIDESKTRRADPASAQLKNKATLVSEVSIETLQVQTNETVPCNKETVRQQQTQVVTT